MDKKEYAAPELTLLGDIVELTKGEGERGSDDQFFYITWGSARIDPTSGY